MSVYQLDFNVPSELPTSLPVLPLRRGLLLPAAISPFAVGRKKSRRALEAAESDGSGIGKLILVAVQRDNVDDPNPSDLLPYGVVARVVESQAHRNSTLGVLLHGLCRVRLREFTATGPYMRAGFSKVAESWPDTPDANAALSVIRDHVESSEALERLDPRLVAAVEQAGPHLLVDLVASSVEGDDEWRRDILLTPDPVVRAEKVIKQAVRIRELTAARKSLEDRVKSDTEEFQREVLLRRQLKAIQDELGEGEGGDDDELSRIKKKLSEADLPKTAQEAVDRELKRLGRLGSPAEKSVSIDWLEWMSDLPWSVASGVDVDLEKLEQVLDESHHGLSEVKRQVVEHLAVRKLGGNGRADVLLLVGPPGVGKTSIGQAIADASGRELVRVALGGVRDESELRGHRRTYVGARPGRLIEGLRRAKTADPVILLDEIDKLGRGWQGDPAAALLEILDPEQNHSFTDHYMEVPFDLSKVLFVATANDLSTVTGPLRDRMEVLQIDGYTADEKRTIATKHLMGKLATNVGLEPTDVQITQEALTDAIAGWTREAGVRQLQRVIGKIFRAAAVKKARGALVEPLLVGVADLKTYLGKRKFNEEAHETEAQTGIATGLAWTPAGGDVLYVEASTFPGNGKLTLTGQLGDVMKESARAALTYVLSNGNDIGIPTDAIAEHDVHIHVPAGAVPKDGPSAGVTMFTALASLLSDRKIASDIAMTGEATLRGRVLPVGGIKSKVLAAHRKGLKRVIIPRMNEGDLEELPEQTKAEMEFILVDDMTEVLESALEPEVKAA